MIDGTDHALLERYRRGDAAAFRALVVRYQRPVYNAAFGVLRNADDARDVAQTVFLRVAERADDYDPSHKFFSWIYRIAVNTCIDRRRKPFFRSLFQRADGVDADDGGVDALPSAGPSPERLVESQQVEQCPGCQYEPPRDTTDHREPDARAPVELSRA